MKENYHTNLLLRTAQKNSNNKPWTCFWSRALFGEFIFGRDYYCDGLLLI